MYEWSELKGFVNTVGQVNVIQTPTSFGGGREDEEFCNLLDTESEWPNGADNPLQVIIRVIY